MPRHGALTVRANRRPDRLRGEGRGDGEHRQRAPWRTRTRSRFAFQPSTEQHRFSLLTLLVLFLGLLPTSLFAVLVDTSWITFECVAAFIGDWIWALYRGNFILRRVGVGSPFCASNDSATPDHSNCVSTAVHVSSSFFSTIVLFYTWSVIFH